MWQCLFLPLCTTTIQWQRLPELCLIFFSLFSFLTNCFGGTAAAAVDAGVKLRSLHCGGFSPESSSVRRVILLWSVVPTCGLSSRMAVEFVKQEAETLGVSVLKSPSDKREYELVHLPNGLCALLVHDPGYSSDSTKEEDSSSNYDSGDEDQLSEDGEAEHGEDCAASEEEGDEENNATAISDDDKTPPEGRHFKIASGRTKKLAAAAMCVGVGSFSDPKDGQGMAHFLEHMLFMGSSKFPNENEYDAFLSKHGGSSNAFTETELTCYYFGVNHKFLKPALDRFSQFFISPLVKANAMEREIQAVDSEYEGHLQSDASRLTQLQCNTSYPLHPFNSFSYGNRKSLNVAKTKGIDLRNKLLDMYRDHYLGGKMKLAVIGGEPLETLKNWVVELFSEVRGGGQGQLKFPWEGPVWEPGKLYRVKSVKDQHYLSINWPFPCLEEAYLRKPQDYLSHLIGHEGDGSLLSLLKSKGWAMELSAGVGASGFDRCSACYMFNATIQLTDSGLEKAAEVVGFFYQYVRMLHNVGPMEWVFKELQAMAEMEFRFAEEEHADAYAVTLTSNMHLYPEKHIIYGDYAHEVWDPVLVQRLLDWLIPGNMRLDLVTKSFNMESPGVQYEPWFSAPYTVEDISSSLMELWSESPYIHPMLHMPVKNEYIPRDFSIREGKGAYSDVPTVLMEDSSMKIWYKLDRKFRMPRANVYYLITCTGAYDTVDASVAAELYVRLIKDALTETLYLANIARLESSLSVAMDRIEIKLNGFNDKLAVLASKIAALFGHFVPSMERFLVIKEEMEREYKNTNLKPLKHATYLRLQILRKQFWHVDDKLLVLSHLSLEDLKSFIPRLLSQVCIESLCHGNLLEEEAIAITKIFRDSLLASSQQILLGFRESILKLPAGISVLHNADAKNPSEENSVVELYFQLEQDLGHEMVRARAMNDLAESIFFEPYFNELRTKEQLGYNVNCKSRITYRVLGFCFYVQSAKYSPPYLEQRMATFIAGLEGFLESMTEKEFDNYVDALISEIIEDDNSLAEETNRYWTEIVDRRYMFDIEKLEAAELRRIKKRDFIVWYNTYLNAKSPNRRKLAIFVWGSNARAQKGLEDVGISTKGASESVNVVDDLSILKIGNEYYNPLC
eukprot:c25983_g1_i2 orf=79-3465(+)